MKCPKCGFNSFEFHDNCKKCGTNLASFKSDLNIRPIILDREQPLAAVVPVLAEDGKTPPPVEENLGTFTWDTPETDDSALASDSGFSGFELDFLKQEEKPAGDEFDFSFGDETVSPAPVETATEDAANPGDFSFYEETIEPGKDQSFTGTAAETTEMDSLFGETGVIGEILPEKLQEEVGELELADIVEDSPAGGEKYENEFNWGDLPAMGEEKKEEAAEVKKDPVDFADFEKEFESIFRMDDKA